MGACRVKLYKTLVSKTSAAIKQVRGEGEWQDGRRGGGRAHKRLRFCPESRCELARCEKGFRIVSDLTRARARAHERTRTEWS